MKIDLNDEFMSSIGVVTNIITFEKTEKEGNAIDIILVEKGKQCPVNLDEKIKRRIFRFQHQGSIQQSYDCNDYLHYIHGFERVGDTVQWKVASKIESEENLRAGDSILLTDERGNWVHVALFLGKGRYLSKIGTGPVVVSTLNELQEYYRDLQNSNGTGPMYTFDADRLGPVFVLQFTSMSKM